METHVTAAGRWQFPLPLLCPVCREPLHITGDSLECPARRHADCPGRFRYRHGFPDLVIGGRFEDATDQACMAYEEDSNEYTTANYWIPLFRKMHARTSERPRILAVGCGIGREVDMLVQAGFDCYGIDNGNRTNVWPGREHPQRLLLANGMHLPFAEGSFDGLFCGCVFPHVGVVGDTNVPSPRCTRDRTALAAEMTRVVKPGGAIVVSSPNRWCPLDIFHGRRPGSYRPRFNPPTSRFLLSVGDYRRLFRSVGCRRAAALPVRGYWGFVRSRANLKGRFLGLPVRSAFALSSLLPMVRGWPTSPWIVVHVTR